MENNDKETEKNEATLIAHLLLKMKPEMKRAHEN